jgi:anti-sigma regulatory factor (Ser/Thr protein kinase)
MASVSCGIDSTQASKVDICFESVFESGPVIRDIVSTFLSAYNMPKTWINRFYLVVDELINNAIEHGSATGEENTMIIVISRIPYSKNIEVLLETRDTGHGPKPKKSSELYELKARKQMQGFENYLGKRGRGVLIMAKLMDSIDFYDLPQGGIKTVVHKIVPITSAATTTNSSSHT